MEPIKPHSQSTIGQPDCLLCLRSSNSCSTASVKQNSRAAELRAADNLAERNLRHDSGEKMYRSERCCSPLAFLGNRIQSIGIGQFVFTHRIGTTRWLRSGLCRSSNSANELGGGRAVLMAVEGGTRSGEAGNVGEGWVPFHSILLISGGG
jgi:hypothetical protein